MRAVFWALARRAVLRHGAERNRCAANQPPVPRPLKTPLEKGSKQAPFPCKHWVFAFKGGP